MKAIKNKTNGLTGDVAMSKGYATIDRSETERRDGFPVGWTILWLALLFAWLYNAQAFPKNSAVANRRPVVAASFVNPFVAQVDSIGITVSDADKAVEFYSKVLSFEKVSDIEVAGEDYERLQGVFGLRMRVVRMKLGDEFIELTQYIAPEGRPVPVDSRSNDRWFQHIAIITNDMERAYLWLRQNKVRHASTNPQRLPDWNKNAAGIKAFYFKDPDGHALEILQFPEGKGFAKWHTKTDKLFLGIDHTAIVVADTNESLKLYRDVLDLKIAGTSENYGTEQEHLNNVEGARLRITSLQAADGGPGIEFLEYIAPRNGRATPADTKANDLWSWQTNLVTRSLNPLMKVLIGKSVFVSTDLTILNDTALGFSKGFLVRDSDGHALRLIERLEKQ